MSSECCDHSEYGDVEKNVYDDSKPRWTESLRTRGANIPTQSGRGNERSKPIWKASVKSNSPSVRTYSEGGSLRTQRMRPRSRSTARVAQSRSKSPGLFGSTFASRAKQREAIGTPMARSRANSVTSMPPSRSRTRSLSPRRLRRQSESPARAIPKKDNSGQRSRRDLPKSPPKKENIPIPVRKIPEPPVQKKNIPIPVKVSPDPPSRPDVAPRPFRDRYQFEPLGDTLGRSNVVFPGTQAFKESFSDGQYHTKTLESFNSYFKNSNDTSNDSYSQNFNNSLNSSQLQKDVDVSMKSYADNSSRKSSLQNYSKSSFSQNSNDKHNTSYNGLSSDETRLSSNRKMSTNSDKTSQDKSHQRSSSNSYSAQEEYRSENLNGNKRESIRRSSQTRGPQPLWLDAADLPEDGSASAHNQMRRSSSASSKKSVSVIYIKS